MFTTKGKSNKTFAQEANGFYLWGRQKEDKRKGGFNTGVHMVEDCSEIAKDIPLIYMEQLALDKKDELMELQLSDEWLAYLQGFKDKEGDYNVYDIWVPEQHAGLGSVETDPKETRPKDCIGTIHSHGYSNSKTNFSSVDEDFLLENYFVSIVTTGENMTGAVKLVTPCGHYKVVETEVVPVRERTDLKKWLAEIKPKIKKIVIATAYQPNALDKEQFKKLYYGYDYNNIYP